MDVGGRTGCGAATRLLILMADDEALAPALVGAAALVDAALISASCCLSCAGRYGGAGFTSTQTRVLHQSAELGFKAFAISWQLVARAWLLPCSRFPAQAYARGGEHLYADCSVLIDKIRRRWSVSFRWSCCVSRYAFLVSLYDGRICSALLFRRGPRGGRWKGGM